MDKYTKKIIKYKNDNIYLIFYSKWCSYSNNAIDLLKKNNIPYKKYNIDKHTTLTNLLNNFINTKNITNFNPSHTTRPIIFKNGKFIGGYDDLKKHIQHSITNNQTK